MNEVSAIYGVIFDVIYRYNVLVLHLATGAEVEPVYACS